MFARVGISPCNFSYLKKKKEEVQISKISLVAKRATFRVCSNLYVEAKEFLFLDVRAIYINLLTN